MDVQTPARFGDASLSQHLPLLPSASSPCVDGRTHSIMKSGTGNTSGADGVGDPAFSFEGEAEELVSAPGSAHRGGLAPLVHRQLEYLPGSLGSSWPLGLSPWQTDRESTAAW